MTTASDMHGKAALVTGAAAGLGRATVLRLARAGADVCLVDLDADGLEVTANEVRELGVRALPHATDLADATNCRAAVDAALQAFGRLDALCNIAAVFIPCHADAMSTADWDRTLAVNLSPPFHLIQAALPRSDEHPSELQSLLRISYAASYLHKKHRYTTT